jgi:hypothetical protein
MWCSPPRDAIALCEYALEEKPANSIRDLANAGATRSSSHRQAFISVPICFGTPTEDELLCEYYLHFVGFQSNKTSEAGYAFLAFEWYAERLF